MSQKLSINATTMIRWNFQQEVSFLAINKISALGAWRHKLSDLSADDAVRVLRDFDISLSHLAWAGGFTGSEGLSHEESIREGIAAVQQTKRLGADLLVVHTGSQGGHTLRHAWRLFREALDELFPVANALGVRLAIEPMHPACSEQMTFVNEIDQYFEIREQPGCDQLQLVFDTYHLAHDEYVVHRLEELTPYIALVQLADANEIPSEYPDRLIPGDGHLPLQAIVDSLVEHGYEGYWDFELYGHSLRRMGYSEIISRSAKAFRTLLRKQEEE